MNTQKQTELDTDATLDRPTAAGSWIFRIPNLAGFDWQKVEVIEENGVLCAPCVEGWGMNRGEEWFGEWRLVCKLPKNPQNEL